MPNSAGGGSILAEVDEDGPGPAPSRLYSATRDRRVVRWDGSTWTTVGALQGSGGVTGEPYAMIGFDRDGAGPQPGSLFVAGAIRSVSGVPAHGLARYGCEENWDRCVGDVNDDNTVNFDDITDVLTNWGAVGSAGFPAYGDANQDYSVGFTDLTAVLTSWGGECAGARPAGRAPGIASDESRVPRALIEAYESNGYSGIVRSLLEH